jgi:hypothetical protein
LELSKRYPIFVGFKLDTSMKRQLDGLEGPARRYVSRESSDFLRICSLGDDRFVGKVIEDGLSTDRVDDVRRNVLSILQRLLPETRLPQHLEIFACLPEPQPEPASELRDTEA